MGSTMEPAILVSDLSKTYGGRRAVDGVSFAVAPGEMVALIGASGAGKSTLLRLLAGLVKADLQDGQSRIEIFGRPVQIGGRLAEGARAVRAQIAVVFQRFNLVERLSVLTNTLLGTLGRLPAWRGTLGLFPAEEQRIAMRALKRVGIGDYARRRAGTLSGGEQQRAAIARALVQDARVILADEPIASLDPRSARRIMEILSDINASDGRTMVVSLHQVEYAIQFCPRTIALKDGRLVFDGPSRALTPERLAELYGSAAAEIA